MTQNNPQSQQKVKISKSENNDTNVPMTFNPMIEQMVEVLSITNDVFLVALMSRRNARSTRTT